MASSFKITWWLWFQGAWFFDFFLKTTSMPVLINKSPPVYLDNTYCVISRCLAHIYIYFARRQTTSYWLRGCCCILTCIQYTIYWQYSVYTLLVYRLLKRLSIPRRIARHIRKQKHSHLNTVYMCNSCTLYRGWYRPQVIQTGLCTWTFRVKALFYAMKNASWNNVRLNIFRFQSIVDVSKWFKNIL